MLRAGKSVQRRFSRALCLNSYVRRKLKACPKVTYLFHTCLTSKSMDAVQKFVPFQSFIEPSFWSELTTRKLEEWKLDDGPKPLHASYNTSEAEGRGCRMSYSFDGLSSAQSSSTTTISNERIVDGRLILVNTMEDFVKMNRKALLTESGRKLWERIVDGSAVENPSLLNSLLFTCFADLKKYIYHFWIAYPAFLAPQIVSNSSEQATSDRWVELPQFLDDNQSLTKEFAFLILTQGEKLESVQPISALKEAAIDLSSSILCFWDPSTDSNIPGWPLRNLLTLYAHYRGGGEVKVLCLRRRFVQGEVTTSHSHFLSLQLTPGEGGSMPKVSGWERNEDKVAPKRVDMRQSMDPIQLSENAVTLNLDLMKWRLMPSIQLEKMKGMKCLLFGAGTLGCNIARCLLGWGVRNMTLLDNSNVSYSNPVRQSLFTFQDAVTAKPKSEAAKDGILAIHPSANVVAKQIRVPMPGHIVDPKYEAESKSAVMDLETMVKEHDALFLLMDTREARWLPTLLATAFNKVCFTVALGFDSFVVIRHGVGGEALGQEPPKESSKPLTVSSWKDDVDGSALGCYFCSDVTAPGNSSHDRTLDQQCTVARPGLSMQAAGTAVELLASMVQHPSFPLVPASNQDDSSNIDSCLGKVPHQVRCYTSRFQQITPCVQRFQHCCACSPNVVNEYRRKNWAFLRDAFNSPDTLEKIAGLLEIQNSTIDIDIDLSDSELSTTSNQ